MKPPAPPPVLDAELQRLTTASRAELAQMWFEEFGHPLPKAISRKLMERILAYHLQVRHLGGLSKRTHRLLMTIGSQPGSALPKPPIILRPGTRLIREWHGHTHVVETVENGFSWNGSIHRSLSAVARAISGARWSGRRFFGL
jgi:hypothetical protein